MSEAEGTTQGLPSYELGERGVLGYGQSRYSRTGPVGKHLTEPDPERSDKYKSVLKPDPEPSQF